MCERASFPYIRLRERSSVQMFLIKHIVRRVKPPIMNSSSVCEKAAVEGTMGICAADRGSAAHTAVALKMHSDMS